MGKKDPIRTATDTIQAMGKCKLLSHQSNVSSFITLCICRYNRQFRYEERTADGYVKGRYGFYDKYGKLQVVNYTADPYKGFHAEGAHVPKYPH